ncbi:MAG: HlyD family efflux transporter periplasmic adaptor subunit, partial [Bacteroidetes bacterium]|nr:HlyD family efflux transporter periplasmic adaptor subunit [Bacteroidota bacterium]
MPTPSHPGQEEPRLARGRDDVQRMLGKPPGWALRWGITAVFLAVVLLLFLAWLIRYPDTVAARVVLTTAQPPVRLLAEQRGRLQSLRVADGEAVERGQVVAILQNTARTADVLRLERWLQGGETAPPAGLSVGILQSLYAQLLRQYEDYGYFQQRTDVEARLVSLREQIHYREALDSTLTQKRRALQREVELARQNLDRNQALAESGNLSQVDLEQTEADLLRVERQLEDVRAELLQNQLRMEQLRAERIRLGQSQSNESVEKSLQLQETRATLDAALQDWKQRFLSISPIAGRVSMREKLVEGQYLEAGQLLMTIVPQGDTARILARGYLPVRNSGRVEAGMRVNMFLDAYPQQQFGA